jgi:hypothetical protein
MFWSPCMVESGEHTGHRLVRLTGGSGRSRSWNRPTITLYQCEWRMYNNDSNNCYCYYYYFIIILNEVRLSPLGTAATTGLLYQPQMIDNGVYGATGRMKIGRGNRNTRREPAPVPLSPPHIPHDEIRDRTRAAAVGSQQLTAWAKARPAGRVQQM